MEWINSKDHLPKLKQWVFLTREFHPVCYEVGYLDVHPHRHDVFIWKLRRWKAYEPLNFYNYWMAPEPPKGEL